MCHMLTIQAVMSILMQCCFLILGYMARQNWKTIAGKLALRKAPLKTWLLEKYFPLTVLRKCTFREQARQDLLGSLGGVL